LRFWETNKNILRTESERKKVKNNISRVFFSQRVRTHVKGAMK
jgi:hypothetical protein